MHFLPLLHRYYAQISWSLTFLKMGSFISISQGFGPPFWNMFYKKHCLLDAFELLEEHGLKKGRNRLNKDPVFSIQSDTKTK